MPLAKCIKEVGALSGWGQKRIGLKSKKFCHLCRCWRSFFVLELLNYKQKNEKLYKSRFDDKEREFAITPSRARFLLNQADYTVIKIKVKR